MLLKPEYQSDVGLPLAGAVVLFARRTDSVGIANVRFLIGCIGRRPSGFHPDAEIPVEKILHSSGHIKSIAICKIQDRMAIDWGNAIMRKSE